MIFFKFFGLIAVTTVAVAQTPNNALQVANSGGNASSPLQYGLMFEDINHSGDGGIYAELIRNRAFQGSDFFPSSLTGWGASKGATLSLDTNSPLSAALPTSVRIIAGDTGVVSLVNEGWWGIEVKPQTYTGSFYVNGAYEGQFVTSLQSTTTGSTLALTNLTSRSVADAWTQHTFTLNPTNAASDTNNTFSIAYDAAGADDPLNFNLISLFPPTYNNRPNGMRVDLMNVLKDMAPSFLRFPGGNNLEGDDPPHRWIWNETIGPLVNRPGRPGVWGYENTDGLGLIEYLWWCQDLNMEPILDVWAGLYLDGPVISEADLAPYVQDVLNELEFIMDNLGGGLPSYQGYRFAAFYNAIKERYPDMNVLASTVDITLSEDAIGDYHTYSNPDALIFQFNQFDHGTSEHKTLVSEYANIQPNATQQPRMPFPNWAGTVAEAVYLIGLERNSHATLGAAYAPLFQNLNSYQWTPDLISFTADPSQTVLSTSYEQIKLFSNTRFTTTLPITTTTPFGPAYFVAGKNEATNSYFLKAAVFDRQNPTAAADVPFTVIFEGVEAGASATLTVLNATSPEAMNMSGGEQVVRRDVSMLMAEKDGRLSFRLPGLSVALLEVKV
ncbi:hypothetical protein EPUS_09374 [Endocarpon pusillum Z07020]|uniref:non-reducing end alpha-L-arabinofuranosidase n=1 Tax=Endocarpon pusillum (strain Z07020 / HMAS-L-300199) TaxID=1263415 RepID=U1G3X6_ENDPU|nr:uncharacterized protein EPUS_09374 [Endocarpon pusillum Z07020]ERF72007.1 hypothetical protein EPUS_09374 [Endocarpon pusillum Z07020]